MRTLEWWEFRRMGYNGRLLLAGVAAYLCYLGVLQIYRKELIGERASDMPMLTQIVILGIFYLLVIVVANFCYYLGPIAEWLVKPRDPGRFRRTTYRIGCWFSMALPFLLPLAMAINAEGR